ncbi:MAG TPA: hypothetical protein VEC16_00155, partial [Alphaproteobacteria bacterium]|nr:hypothetical protein [Alphaproteobacteria bacterium]
VRKYADQAKSNTLYPEIILDGKIVPHNGDGVIVTVYKSKHNLKILNKQGQFNWMIIRSENIASSNLRDAVTRGSLDETNNILDINVWATSHNPDSKEMDLIVRLIPKGRVDQAINVKVMKANFRK